MALMSAIMAKLADWPWEMIAAFLSAAVLVLYLAVEFIRPHVRRRKLKRPCNVQFVIHPTREGHSDYAIQDDNWHFAKEITLPPASDFHVEIMLRPRLNFVESEFAFGCSDDSPLDADKKPFATGYINSFIVRGKKSATPEEDENHYTDRHGFYHIRRSFAQRSVGQDFIVGLKLRTRAVGVFKVEVWLTTEEKQGIDRNLTIRVEEPPKTLVKCSVHRDCYIRPDIKAAAGREA
jgi:hypothetical protein